MNGSQQTTAATEGPAWSAAAVGSVEHWARFAAPAREAVAQAAGIEAGDSVLDVGCGSAEFGELAAARGACVSGIDAAAGLIDLARGRLPEGTYASVPSSSSLGRTTASTWSAWASTPFSPRLTSRPPSPRRGG
jgi:trans-aconitate methyltransferase